MDTRSVLITGTSVRAFAESATRAGYGVMAVDAFGDLDLERAARRCIAVPGRFSAARAVRAARAGDTPCDATAYVSGFENHPRAVAQLNAIGPLWGNRPEILARVRDPLRLARALRRRGFPTPEIRVSHAPESAAARWLMKPRASGGGHGIRSWRPGGRRRLSRSTYLQERIPGVAGSIVFAADGRRAVPFGLSRALQGERAFGASGFRYSGSMLARAAELPLAAAAALATAITEEFGLVGVNGIDFIARDSLVYAIEVNPRYSASMELAERAYGISVFAVHARACAGELPAFDLARALEARQPVHGKAIVYARRTTTMPDTRRWLANIDVRDIPQPGQVIARGRPVCTVFAQGRSHQLCRRALATRAAEVYDAIAAPVRRSA